MMNIRTNYTQPAMPVAGAQTNARVRKHEDAGRDTTHDLVPADGATTQSVGAPEQPVAAANTVLSKEEKAFFQELFPTAAEEIRTYTPYLRNGRQQASQIGTLIDAKG